MGESLRYGDTSSGAVGNGLPASGRTFNVVQSTTIMRCWLIGVKEIERLIAKLQLDKEILADPDSDDKSE